MPLKVAIDGGAGTGKSTVAKRVSEVLGIPFLNTGQLYRAVAFLVVRVFDGDPHHAAYATEVARSLVPYIEGGYVHEANGYLLRDKLDADDISAASSAVAKHPGVRAALVKVQQDYASQNGAVMEGRDIGTVILPDADVKFFLVCDPEERARRRRMDGFDETAEDIMARDKQDSEREAAPLRQDVDAIRIDTTDLQIGEVVRLIVGYVRQAQVV